MSIMAHRSSNKRPFSAPALNRPGKLQKTAPPSLQGPLHDARYIESQHDPACPPPKPSLLDNPKSPVANLAAALAIPLNYSFTDLFDPAANRRIVRSVSLLLLLFPAHSPHSCALLLDTAPQITAIGDHTDKKSAERLCALSALYQLHDRGLVRTLPFLTILQLTRV
jgi:small subunit ribosomal protein S24e